MTAEDFYQQAYDLGYPPAAVNLSLLYTKEQACMMKYLEEGVKRGNAQCMTNLGDYTSQSGNHEDAKRHLMTAARSGHDNAMHKDDLATTLRAHKAISDKRTSEPREYAMRHKVFEEKRRDRSVVSKHGRRA